MSWSAAPRACFPSDHHARPRVRRPTSALQLAERPGVPQMGLRRLTGASAPQAGSWYLRGREGVFNFSAGARR